MRVACVQLASKLGDVSWNVRRVRELVSSIDGSLDLLVLPEMAVTGYNFRDRSHILPFCEDRHAIGSASPSLSLARELSHQFKGARVVVGFPEREDSTSQTKLYNSAAIVNEAGLQHIYRKHFLFDTDKRWATAGDAFGDVTIDDKRTALGIVSGHLSHSIYLVIALG
ncbi:Carbon-nitrogen hydrolase [Savitreella phatthalungensis]